MLKTSLFQADGRAAGTGRLGKPVSIKRLALQRRQQSVPNISLLSARNCFLVSEHLPTTLYFSSRRLPFVSVDAIELKLTVRFMVL